MPNGVKPVDPLDSLSSVGSAYRSSGQPGTCKYWILDLGTLASPHAPSAAASQVAAGTVAVRPTLKCRVLCAGACERGLCGWGGCGELQERKEKWGALPCAVVCGLLCCKALFVSGDCF